MYTFVKINRLQAEYDPFSPSIKELFIAFAIVGGIPWFANEIKSGFSCFFYLFVKWQTHKRKYKGRRNIDERLRCKLIDRFTAAGNKAISRPEHVYAVFYELGSYESYVENELHNLREKITRLQEDNDIDLEKKENTEARKTRELGDKKTDESFYKQRLALQETRLLYHSVHPK